MGVLEGLLKAGGSIATSIINNKYEDQRAREQRDWSEAQTEKQYQHDLDMWNMTNEYNAPGAQLQRMRDAGLNPLYQGLDGSSASSISAPQPLGYERASNPTGIANPVEAFLSGSLDRAKIDNLNSDTAKKNNENITETERRQNIVKEREGLEHRIQLYKDAHKLNDKEIEKLDKYLEYADDMYASLIAKDQAYVDLSNTQKDRIEKLLPGETVLQYYTIQDYSEKWKYWQKQIDHIVHQDNLLAKQAKYYLVSLLTNGAFGTGVSAVNGLVLDMIEEDPDLTSSEREKVKDGISRGFNMSHKSKDRTHEFMFGPKHHPYESPIISR